MTLRFTILLVALTFEFLNGFHDPANSVAAVVGTKVLTPTRAMAVAAVMNLCGTLLGTAVATTVGKGFVQSDYVTASVLPATAHLGMPVSTTHVVSTSIMGVGTARSTRRMNWSIVESIVWAWILTLPATGLTAYGLWRFSQLLGLVTPSARL